MSATPDTLFFVILIGSFILGAAVLYFVVRGAVISALRHHALYRADGSLDSDVRRHLREHAE